MKTLLLLSLSLFALQIEWNGRLQQTMLTDYDSTISWNLRQLFSINIDETKWNRFCADADVGYRSLFDSKGNQSLSGSDRFQIYGLRLQADLIPDRVLSLDAGRLFLYEAMPVGALDGFRLSGYKKSVFDGAMYGGVESHSTYAPAIYKGSESLIFGLRAAVELPKESRIEGSYLMDMLLEEDAFNRHMTGISVSTRGIPKSSFSIHYVHNLIDNKSHLLSSVFRSQPVDRFQFRLQAEQSQPEILGRSYYERFEIKDHTLLSAGAEIKLIHTFGLSAEYGYLIIDDQKAQRMDLRITDNRGSIGMILERGTEGEETGLVADYALTFLTDWTISAAIDYSQYRIQEGYDLDKAIGNALRLAYAKNGFSAEIEGRWLSNRSLDNSLQIMNRVRFAW